MKKLMILTLALVLLGTLLFAQKGDKNMNMTKEKPMMHGKNMDCDEGPGRMMDELKLSSEQQKKLEAGKIEFEKQKNIMQAEIENMHIDMRVVLKNGDFAKARNLIKAISDKKLAMANARLDHFESVLKELNAEQKEIFKNRIPMMMEGGGPGMHKGGPMRMGKMQGKGGWNSECDDCNMHQGMMKHKK